jgi:N-acetylglucosamine repressor
LRKINPNDFQVATRSTSREVNLRIALNLIRDHQPISRADLARGMKIGRGAVSVLVNQLIQDDLIYEGITGEAARGRKPTFLHIRTKDRWVVAIDIRYSQTYLMLTDFGGRQIALESFDTLFSAEDLVKELAIRIKRLLKTHLLNGRCEGVGVVVPGIVDPSSGKIINAPALGWRNLDIKDQLNKALELPIHIENAARACALAQLWMGKNSEQTTNNFVYVSVSDGVGVGVVVRGELVRGRNFQAGEFGHIPLSEGGPRCLCGSVGCWEAYVSNVATLARYFGTDLTKLEPKSLLKNKQGSFSIPDLILCARSKDPKAKSALEETARYLGMGLSIVVNAFNPDRIFLGGEITQAWDIIEPIVRSSLARRAMTENAAATPIDISLGFEHPRLRGAATLVAAPNFAAPRLA